MNENQTNQTADEFLQSILKDAIHSDASDIHFEPLPGSVRIRFRIDGALVERWSGSPLEFEQILNRIKILANLDITTHVVPQDGHFEISGFDQSNSGEEAKNLNARVSVFPTVNGEAVVLRIFDRAEMIMTLDSLGMDEKTLERIKHLIAKSYGMALVTGPAGSGKTTLLYSILQQLKNTNKNIITLEDPVEFHFKEFRQSQMHPAQGLDFPTAMRSVLRQDPDVLMIGEIRDPNTAEYAIRASLTGRIVFSTVHSNSTIGTIARLLDMEIKPSLIAYSLNGIVAKRLVKTVCPHCAVEYTPSPELISFFDLQQSNQRFVKGAGCNECLNTGYQERTGIFEVLEIDDNLRSLIVQKKTMVELQKYAEEAGMKTLRQDALEKVFAGITTLEEIIKVV